MQSLVQQHETLPSPMLNNNSLITQFPHQTYILFINTKSGGGWGKRYFTLCAKQITFKFKKTQLSKNLRVNLTTAFSSVGSDESNTNQQRPFYKSPHKNQTEFFQPQQIQVRVEFYDLTKTQDLKLGIKSVHNHTCLTPYQDSTRVIICGGDGTILWVIQQIAKAQIDLSKILFGTIPIGTGNDFSRSIGWGAKAVHFCQDSISGLLKVLKQWVVSQTSFFDIWDIEITTHPQGRIYMAQNKSEVPYLDKNFRRSFSNYFGIGIDARVAYKMQQHRGTSVMMNMIVYACVGFCYLFKKARSISNTVQNFIQFTEKPQQHNQITEKSLTQSQPSPEDQNKKSKTQEIINDYQMNQEIDKKMLNNSVVKRYIIKNGNQSRNIDGSFKALVCLNCTSYMAGNQNVWKTQKSVCKYTPMAEFTDQKYNDGKVQFVAFKHQLDMALQSVFRRSSKVAQGSGPFLIQTKARVADQQTYVQIDGESFKITGLKSISVSKSNKVINGKIRILVCQ